MGDLQTEPATRSYLKRAVFSMARGRDMKVLPAPATRPGSLPFSPLFGLLLCAAIFLLSGCQGVFQKRSDDQKMVESRPSKWAEQRGRHMDAIRAGSKDRMKCAEALINMSDRPFIDGRENIIHGQLLSEAKTLLGDEWPAAMEKARHSARNSAEILIEAHLSGASFSIKPGGVVLRRDSDTGVYPRTVSLDLSDRNLSETTLESDLSGEGEDVDGSRP